MTSSQPSASHFAIDLASVPRTAFTVWNMYCTSSSAMRLYDLRSTCSHSPFARIAVNALELTPAPWQARASTAAPPRPSAPRHESTLTVSLGSIKRTRADGAHPVRRCPLTVVARPRGAPGEGRRAAGYRHGCRLEHGDRPLRLHGENLVAACGSSEALVRTSGDGRGDGWSSTRRHGGSLAPTSVQATPDTAGPVWRTA